MLVAGLSAILIGIIAWALGFFRWLKDLIIDFEDSHQRRWLYANSAMVQSVRKRGNKWFIELGQGWNFNPSVEVEAELANVLRTGTWLYGLCIEEDERRPGEYVLKGFDTP
jgi:hypothetical protein